MSVERTRPIGGTLIFSYIRRLGPFLEFKILNFNIFGVFSYNILYSWGYEEFSVDIFRCHHKTGLVLGVILFVFS